MTLTTQVKERAEKRKALIAAQRHAQHVRRKARIAQYYRDSVIELREVNKELREASNRLRGARLAYTESLPSEVAKALEYARGFTDGKAALLQEQAEEKACLKPNS